MHMSGPTDDVDVLDPPDEHRFMTARGGAEAELVYRLDGERMLIVHTEFPDVLGDRASAGPW